MKCSPTRMNMSTFFIGWNIYNFILRKIILTTPVIIYSVKNSNFNFENKFELIGKRARLSNISNFPHFSYYISIYFIFIVYFYFFLNFHKILNKLKSKKSKTQ